MKAHQRADACADGRASALKVCRPALRWLGRALRRAAAVAAAGLLFTAPAAAWQAEVLDVAELPTAWQAHELSGLAWVPQARALMAVSDRGLLWHLPVEWSGPAGALRLRLGTPTPARMLGTPGAPRPNAEALAWRPDTAGGAPAALLVADEAQHRVLAVDAEGRVLHTLPVPGPAEQAMQLRGANAGIEALAWHPALGLIAAPQRPVKGADATLHRLHAAGGQHWGFRAAGPKSSLKALEALDGSTLLALERVGAGRSQQAVLRPLVLEGCGGERLCDAPALVLSHPALQGRDNFEGMACVGDGLCLVVSDDGGTGRTRLLLVRLQR